MQRIPNTEKLSAIRWSDIALTVILVLFGAAMIIVPDIVQNYLLIAVGAVLFLFGIVTLVRYFRAKGLDRICSNDFVIGLFQMLSGLFVIWQRFTLGSLLAYLFGLALFVAAAYHIQNTLNMHYLKSEKWYLHLIGVVVSLVFGIIIISVPYVSMVFLGIALVVQGIMFILSRLFSKHYLGKTGTPVEAAPDVKPVAKPEPAAPEK